MNLAALQADMLRTLLEAIKPVQPAAKAGDTAQGRFLGFTGATADGAEAEARIAGQTVRLVLTDALRADPRLQPGAALTLSVMEPAGDGKPALMRLIDIRSAAGPASDDADAAPRPLADPVAQRIAAGVAARAAAAPLLAEAPMRQASLQPLLANLQRLLDEPSFADQPVPPDLRKAAAQALMTLARAGDLASGEAPGILRQALRAAGLPPAAREAPAPANADVPGTVGAETANQNTASPRADQRPAPPLLATLLGLKEALGKALDSLPKAPVTPSDRPTPPDGASDRRAAPGLETTRLPPPQRDMALLPQRAMEAGLEPARQSASDAIKTLALQTDAAIDRSRLTQLASLPTQADLTASQPQTRIHIELPLLIDGRPAILPFTVEEELPRRGDAIADEAKRWRIRFALDVEPLGPVHAALTMHGRTMAVAVWAEMHETSDLIRRHAGDLREALLADRFDEIEVDIRHGAPKILPASAGQFLDRRS